MKEDLKILFLNTFSLRMKDSGYDERFREEVIKSGMEGYQKQVERDRSGVCPLHRPKGYNEEERKKKKQIQKASWYRPYQTVLFCPPTPDSTLAKQLRHIAENATRDQGILIRIKVVETAGVSIMSQLPGLKEEEDCGREKCVVHGTGGKGNCRSESVVYRGVCVSCRDRGPTSYKDRDSGCVKRVEERKPGTVSVYYGETSRTGFQRGLKHMDAMAEPKKRGNKDNAFAKHVLENHKWDRVKVGFKVDIIKKFKSPLERQIWEGLEIHNSKPDILMNSKQDHYQPAVPRIIVSNRL